MLLFADTTVGGAGVGDGGGVRTHRLDDTGGIPVRQTDPLLCAECCRRNQLKAKHIRGSNYIIPPQKLLPPLPFQIESDLVRVNPP